MTSVGLKLCGGLIGAVATSPVPLAGGALAGACYAKCQNLPLKQVAAAWAIWFAVEHVFQTLVTMFNDNESERACIKGFLLAGTTLLAVRELKKRNLVGNQMGLIFILAIRAMYFVHLINQSDPIGDSNVDD